MSHRYSTALSHLILAGTGVYCLSAYGVKELKFPVISYGLIVANSVIGVWRYGNPDYGDKLDKPYRITNILQTIFAVPCLAAQVWLQGGMDPKELVYAHAGLALIPFGIYLTKQNDRDTKDVAEIIIALNLSSMGLVSSLSKKYYGVAAAFSFVINYFVIKDEGDVADSIPALDLFNYGMCFAAYFTLRALAGE